MNDEYDMSDKLSASACVTEKRVNTASCRLVCGRRVRSGGIRGTQEQDAAARQVRVRTA